MNNCRISPPPDRETRSTSPLQGEVSQGAPPRAASTSQLAETLVADARHASGITSPSKGGGRREATGGGGSLRKKPFTKDTQRFAKNLRKTSTDAEQELWYKLRNKQMGIKFRRQQAIGKYIADFVNFDTKLIVELDGGQHADSAHDKIRDQFLRDEGYTVLRFWNHEVFENMEGVYVTIQNQIDALSPPPALRATSPLKGEVSQASPPLSTSTPKPVAALIENTRNASGKTSPWRGEVARRAGGGGSDGGAL